jgi:hypothetical protein
MVNSGDRYGVSNKITKTGRRKQWKKAFLLAFSNMFRWALASQPA